MKISYFRIRHTMMGIIEMVGSKRPSVGRILRDLHKDKIIEADGKLITILNKQEIAMLIH